MEKKSNNQDSNPSVYVENNAQEIVKQELPKGCMAKLFCTHTSTILNNLGILTCTLGLLLFFSFLIPPLYYVILILLTMATVGTIFMFIPKFSKWWGLASKLNENIGVITNISIWILGISAVSSAISLILMLINKERRSLNRIITCVVTLVIAIIGIIIRALNLFGVWDYERTKYKN